MKNEKDTKQSLGCQKLYELQVLWLEFATPDLFHACHCQTE
jgi:hypothetical protein